MSSPNGDRRMLAESGLAHEVDLGLPVSFFAQQPHLRRTHTTRQSWISLGACELRA